VKPRFFATADELRTHFGKVHDTASELWIGFYKKASKRPSVTYHEALDEALSVGWIDGVRKALDSQSYVTRFTPRKRGSYWSAVNTARALALIEQGRMTPAGLRAFEARDAKKTAKYSFERSTCAFDANALRTFKANRNAWTFFSAQPPGYRNVATFFVVSAKREETRAKRLKVLIDDSARGRRLPMLAPPKSK